MTRWRTDGFRHARLVAAALALLLPAVAIGRPNAANAESPRAASSSLSPDKLTRVGDFIRNEIAAGKIPGAVDQFYFPGDTSGFGLGFAVRTAVPPNTSWPLGEYRWDGAGGTFFFIDPRDDMFAIFMVQAPSQSGRIQLALKTLIYAALKN